MILAAVSVVFLIGYLGIYKKVYKGKRQLDFNKILWWIILVFYLFVMLSVTLFRRSVFWNGQIISFFYSYKDAWISASETAWRNIILNILMFVPLGFWLPIGKKRFRVYWKTYLAGWLLTIGIECFQLILSLGLFEVADVFNNTLGTMIGFGVYKVAEYVVQLYKKKRTKLSRMLASQIPLVLTVGMFTALFCIYQKQELGNLSIEYISPYSKGALHIVSNEEYREDHETAIVYQADTLTTEETEVLARSFFENLGTSLDESRNDIYENTAVYWAVESYSMWVDYKGGTYDMTDFDTSYPEEGKEQPQKVVDASEEIILEALEEYGITIPEEAVFSYKPGIGYTVTIERVEEKGTIYDGQLICDYYDNGRFSYISNDIKQFEVYKEFAICSEKEAYEQILDGKFVSTANPGDQIEVEQVSLEYMMDTKGFYQPVYNFSTLINGEESYIQVPAIRK